MDLEPVVCAPCGTALRERAGQEVLRWSAAHCVMASASHPNLIVAAGTLTVASLGRPVEFVGSATVHAETRYHQITRALPHGTLAVTTVRPTDRLFGDTSLTVTAQRHHDAGVHAPA